MKGQSVRPKATSESPSWDILQRKYVSDLNASGFTDRGRREETGRAMGLQRTLAISQPGDRSEQEADRVAEEVLRIPEPKIQRQPVSVAPSVQRKGEGNDAGIMVPPIVYEVLSSQANPLDAATRAYFEPRFGHDFSNVRIHTDTRAVRSAKDVNARAYTVGNHVVFGRGQHEPMSSRGRMLMAHELAHVAQHTAHGSHRTGVLSRQPEEVQEVPWEKDENGNLYYKTQEEAERRKRQLEEAGEWSEYRVTSFETKGTTYWRVEMRGRKQAPAPPSGQQPGATAPTAPATPSGGGTSTGVKRVFSLTFDDGPHAEALNKGTNRTEKVLDTLKAKAVKGGFFIQTGVSFRGASAVGKTLVKRMNTEGHTVGIHTGGTKDHEAHTEALKAGRLSSELAAGKSYITTETGTSPTFVRPPFGRSNAGVQAEYKTAGLTNLLWDIDGDKGASSLAALKARIDSSSAKDPGIPAVQARGWTGTTPSNPKIVILYHDVRKGTANNIGDVIDHIKNVTSKVSGGKDTADFAPP